MADTKDFFKQKRETAEIKGEILPKFFPAWGESVLAGHSAGDEPRFLFVDLNAALGQTAETGFPKPLAFTLKSFLSSFNVNKAVQAFLHDGSKAHLPILEEKLPELPFYDDLLHKPVFLQNPEAREALLNLQTEALRALWAVDPFGYKQSQQMWLSALAQDSTDFLFLFEPAKMKSLLKNPPAGEWQLLLGERVTRIKQFLERKASVVKNEQFLLSAFEDSLKEKQYNVSRFQINVPGKDQASHYVLFVSKDDVPHTRFKEIMLEYSDYQEDGVPTFGANLRPLRLLVPDFARYLPFSMVNLLEDLVQNAPLFNSMRVEKIYEQHNVGTPYSQANYQKAFEQLKEQGKVIFMNPKTGQQVSKMAFNSRVKFKL